MWSVYKNNGIMLSHSQRSRHINTIMNLDADFRISGSGDFTVLSIFQNTTLRLTNSKDTFPLVHPIRNFSLTVR